MEFLAHLVFTNGIQFETQKIEAVQNLHTPTSLIDIRSFLGLAGYYKRSIQGFSSISSPLTKLTQKIVKFQWSETCEESSNEIEKEVDYYPHIDLTRRYTRFRGIL